MQQLPGMEAKRFWRILFVVEEGSTEDSLRRWLKVMHRYAESVTLVSLGDMTAADLIELPADCMVVDGRALDLTGIGMLVTQAGQRSLPSLTLYGGHWQDDDISVLPHAVPGTTLYPYATDDFEHILEEFLHETPPHDYKKEQETAPWLSRPRTISMARIQEAVRQGDLAPPPY